jgi:uridine phosphorylase
MKETLYMKAKEGDIAKYVIFSGDPWRVEVLKKYLDDVVHIGFFREFNTYTGTYKGVRITVTSTGIGAPSAAIAMEEMYNAGMEVAVRMGTVMSLNDDLLGTYVIPSGSVRMEKTSETYVELGYPAVADFELVNSLSNTIKKADQVVDNGINATMDGFYSQMKESRLSKSRNIDFDEIFNQLGKNKVTGVDMESSCMLVVGRLMGVKTAVVTLVTVLKNLKASLEDELRKAKEDELCRLTLEGIYNFSKGE